MARKRTGAVYLLPSGVFAVLVVATTWTVLTGGLWHWLPALGAIAATLLVARILNPEGP